MQSSSAAAPAPTNQSARPQSCDTFVVLPPATSNGCVIFGKNSDRFSDEVQEVVHIPAQDHEQGSLLQCTYMEVLQVPHTHAVILSKPAWMWGAEMGANEHGVCVGNEAVWTKLNGPDDSKEKLLGMDLVRLVLERGSTAKECQEILTSLLREHNQGGPCHAKPDSDPPYHNSFIIADQSEAWVVETAGQHWAAERITCRENMELLALERSHTAELAVQCLTGLLSLYGQGGNCADKGYDFTYHNSFLVADRSGDAFIVESARNHWAVERVQSGFRNISNQLTIRTSMTASSDGLADLAQSRGWWSPDDGPLDFAKAFSSSFEEPECSGGEPEGRQQWGAKLLADLSKDGKFKVQDMVDILRHRESGICMTGGMCSTGSQVSVLPPPDSGAPAVHLFTATANPHQSLFKPFVFCDNATIGDKTTAPNFGDKDPAKVVPRFQTEVDRRHPLWKAHERFTSLLDKKDPKGAMLLEQIREMERTSLLDLEDVVTQGKIDDAATVGKLNHLFQHMVDLEMNFYKMS